MCQTECTLYLIGMCDHDDDNKNLDGYLSYLIERLKKKYEENKKRRFLFHCYAGKSRSVVLALAFMVEVLEMKFDEALSLVYEKRPMIEPRPLFIDSLKKRYKGKKETETEADAKE